MADPEIEAMSAVAAALGNLEEDVQGRVLRWAAERYGVSIPTGDRRGPVRGGGAVSDHEGAGDVTEEEIVGEAPVYEHFAELFAKAQPKTEPDKVLVAAYWLQAIQGHNKWQAAELRKELKNLGHAIGNITDALTSNIRKKPQRIIQLQKAGNTRQARKTYKVTHEGLVYVQRACSEAEPDVSLAPEDAFSVLPSTLRHDLLSAFTEIVNNYRALRWESSELNSGKLCEAVYTIIEGWLDGGTYPARAKKPRQFPQACLGLEQKYQHVPNSHSARILIPPA